MKPVILIEGLSDKSLLQLLEEEEYQAFIISGQPIVFKVGTSELLGQFSVVDKCLKISLGHIEGGGEGILLVLTNIIRKYAILKGYQEIDWIVHAVKCANPNLKLRRVLLAKGFTIQEHEEGWIYRKVESGTFNSQMRHLVEKDIL